VCALSLQGAVYPDSLLLLDVAVDMELTHMEGRVSHASSGKRGHSGGLTLVSAQPGQPQHSATQVMKLLYTRLARWCSSAAEYFHKSSYH
jgi:hypothetical protein